MPWRAEPPAQPDARPESGSEGPRPGRRPRSRARRVLLPIAGLWLLLGASIVALGGLELVLQALFLVKDRLRPLPVPDPRVIAQGYDGAPWVPRLYAEQDRLEAAWQPYSGFRLSSHDGEFIHTDRDGSRWTASDDVSLPEGSSAVLDVLLLGGSSAWGMGARDEATLASRLQAELRRRGIRARVTNLAQIGHVLTQERIALEERLLSGRRPDVVVFYDGVNEVLSAYQNGRAGWPQNASHRANEFNLSARPGRMLGTLASSMLSRSALARLAGSTARRLGLEAGPPSPRRPFNDELAREVATRYAANLELIDTLARTYGFHALLVWQPVLFTRNAMTDYEREKAREYDWLREPFARVAPLLATVDDGTLERARLLDLSRLLDDEPGLVFVDFCHTTEAPNETVARAIASALEPRLNASAGDTP